MCFVCGVVFGSLADMNVHIKEKHEEGREYIKCLICDYCVRDLTSHHKVKHPSRQLPKTGQMKVSVWYDFKSNGQKKTRKPKFRDGYHVSTKTGASLHYRSGYECEVYELLDEDADVASFDVEPFRVPYVFKGEWHDYIPDIRVNFMDKKVEIWEVKPSNQTGLDKNKAKWAAMQAYADKFGWTFMVITETGIGKLRSKMKQQRLLREMGT